MVSKENIPKSWKKVTIDDICELKRGASPRPISDPKYFGNGAGWVRISDVTSSGNYLRQTEQYLSELGESKSVKVTPGDVIMSICATIGRPIIVDMEACIHDGFVVFKNLDKCVNNLFFLYWLKTKEDYFNSLGQHGTQKNLNTNLVKKTELLLPPLSEQRKIAAILSSVDEAIEKTEAIIEQTEKVKKGLMQQLLTKGIGHTKFKKTEIGEIPEEWEVMRLEEIAKVSGGKRLPKGKSLTNVKNGYPYIRVSDMQEDGISLESIQYVPTDVVESIKRYRVKAGDIYISVAGTLGLVGIVPPELDGANLTENADRISEIKCNRIFLKYVLQSDLIQSIIERERTISAQPKLALTRIKGFLIPIPSLEEQKEIADILLTIDKKLKNEKQKHIQLLSIKKGLMQVLLTGKVRVKVDDEVNNPTTKVMGL